MSLAYANEKFSNAVESLAISPYSIHQRLIEAAIYHIIHVDVERDLPDDLQDDVRDLMHRLTKDSPDPSQLSAGDGKIHASVRNLSTDQAIEMAQEIVSLTHRIRDCYEEGPLA